MRHGFRSGTRILRLVATAGTLALAATSSGTHPVLRALLAGDGETVVATISDEGIVTRMETGGARPPNPLRHAPDEVLVRLKHGLSPEAQQRALTQVPSRVVRRFASVERLYHLKLAPGISSGEAIATLHRDRDVLYAEPNFIVQTLAVPNDPSFSAQWALRNTGQTGGTPGADIGAVEAWDVTNGSPDIAVAVIDTGVDYTHPDLAANVFRNPDDCDGNGRDDDGNGWADDCRGIDTVNGDSEPMDDHNHGTHVSGIIGAVGNNAVGVSGVTQRITIVPCKAINAAGFGTDADAIACLDYVAALKDRGLDIVATNNSWGGGLYSQALADAISSQQQRGILFVAAAGNDSRDNTTLRTYPCSYYLPSVLCVAATTSRDERAWFSNYGPTSVHLAAPGDDVLSTTPGNGYERFSGTSMAAPHVSAVMALVHTQWPDRDWRFVKNIVLASGEPLPSLVETVTRRRLSARGALTCTGATVSGRLRPAAATTSTGLVPLEVAALNVTCGEPAGDVTVTVGGSTTDAIMLSDDGVGRDQLAGDGIYTATWTPPFTGTFSLSFPDGRVITVEADAKLKPGFPIEAFQTAGSYHAGPAIHTLVGNIDADPGLEILATSLANGPLNAWKGDGTVMPGWPVFDARGAVYGALGELSSHWPGLEVFTTHLGPDPDLFARTGLGSALHGWPLRSANYVASPPTLADVDGDGTDEIFVEEEDSALHGYRVDARPVPGWPTRTLLGGQDRHTAAVSDLDGDGRKEIITVSGSTSDGAYLLAYHDDGAPVAGFPVRFDGYTDTFPAVADVDGDGRLDIVLAARLGTGVAILVFSSDGQLERTIPATGDLFYGSAPALGDLDGDRIPEIVLQTNTAVNVWKGDGAPLTGWPLEYGDSHTFLNNAAPVVGDLDGDGRPEVVVLSLSSSQGDDVVVLHGDGSFVAGFPRKMPGLGMGAVPAIGDLDLDGRNELIVTSDFWNGRSGYYDKVWAFDLGGAANFGPIPWGQFMGGPRHQGVLPSPPTLYELSVLKAGTGTGVVTSDPQGIACGSDCSESFAKNTTVSLSAVAAASSVFQGWDGPCPVKSATCTFVLKKNTKLTAKFARR
jgi:subtilisin family serine protease